MDENPDISKNHPGVPEEAYHTLGNKTFIMSLMGSVTAPIVFLLIAIVAFVMESQPCFRNVQGYDVQPYVGLAAWILLGLALIIFLFAFLITWLTYVNFKFMLGEDSLKIKRGILNKEEVAIPYRQIQDVDIERNISYRMFGVSRIVILTAGNEEEKKPGSDDESEGILPAIDKNLAEWLQAELLRRANVQKVTETK